MTDQPSGKLATGSPKRTSYGLLTALDIRLHAINLAVAWQRETIQLRREHPRRAAYELLTSAGEFAAWITDGTMPPEPPKLPELRTPAEWEASGLVDRVVLDPDGWRADSPFGRLSWAEPITLDDYKRRAAASTTRPARDDWSAAMITGPAPKVRTEVEHHTNIEEAGRG